MLARLDEGPQCEGRRTFRTTSPASRWCGFVETQGEHRTAYNRTADSRVVELIALAREMLVANEEHVADARGLTRGDEDA